jgi:hypothetical protein
MRTWAKFTGLVALAATLAAPAFAGSISAKDAMAGINKDWYWEGTTIHRWYRFDEIAYKIELNETDLRDFGTTTLASNTPQCTKGETTVTLPGGDSAKRAVDICRGVDGVWRVQN